MKNQALIILIILLTFSCSTEDDAIQETSTTQTMNIESTLIAKNNLYGAGDEGITQQNLVITNTNTWQDLMDQMNSVNDATANFSETEIDFTEYQVIAVFDIIRGVEGYGLDLDVVTLPEGISITITSIVPQGQSPSVITQPYHIIKIPVTNLPIVFE